MTNSRTACDGTTKLAKAVAPDTECFDTPEEPVEKVDPALYKASLKLQNHLISRHGAKGAQRIIDARMDDQRRSRLSKSILSRTISMELNNPESLFWNKELINSISMCELYKL